jgi:hypothetical protein
MRNEPGRRSVGEYLIRRLEEAGVRHYFTVPGDLELTRIIQGQRARSSSAIDDAALTRRARPETAEVFICATSE